MEKTRTPVRVYFYWPLPTQRNDTSLGTALYKPMLLCCGRLLDRLFSLVQYYGIYALEKAHTTSTLSLRSFPQHCFGNGFSVVLTGSRSGELRTQKLKSILVRRKSLNVLPLKPGVGQYIDTYATLTAREFFLVYFYPSGPFSCIFSKTSLNVSCVGCG